MLRLLRFALSVSRSATSVVLLLAVAAGLAGTVLTYLVGQVVGAAQGLADGQPVGRFVGLVSAMLLVFVLNGTLPVVWMTAVVTLEMRLDRAVGIGLARPLLEPRQIGHLEDLAVQDAYGRSRAEAPVEIRLGPTFAAQVLQGLIGSITSAVLIGLLFRWWVPIPLAVSAGLTTWYVVWASGREDALWSDSTEGQRHADYVSDLAMSVGPKEIRIFGLSSWLVERYLQARRVAMAPIWHRRWRVLGRDLIVLLPHVAVFAVVIVYATLEAFDGRLPLASAVAVIPAMIGMALGFDPWLLGQARKALGSLKSFQRLPEVIAAGHPHSGDRHADLSEAPRDAIRFEDVSFHYPGTDGDVLHHLNLEIRADEALALVGVNGAGKSTLVKLLAGGYRPTRGRITVDDVDLATLDPMSLGGWQRRVAAIVQDFVQLPLSMRENVTLSGDSSPLPSGRAAGIVELAESLPNGWDTVLDKTFPGGVDLSGGQWQRVALARALHAVEAGAGVLVLDEPAAALDVRSEAALVERYLGMTAGVTSLIISHRFSVVRDAHRICVLGDGAIIESGTHQELLARDGVYARMFRLQAARYLEAEPDNA